MNKDDRKKASDLTLEATHALQGNRDAADPLVSALLLMIRGDHSKTTINLRMALLDYRQARKTA